MGKGKNPPQRNTPHKRHCNCGEWYDPTNDAQSTLHAQHTGR